MLIPNKNIVIKRLEKTGSKWLSDFRKFSDDDIIMKSHEKEWCLAELYDHVMRVARTYQIPNFRKALNGGEKKRPKNIPGYVVFNINYLPERKIKMEDFPSNIVTDFTPVIRGKEELIVDFTELLVGVMRVINETDHHKLRKKKHNHPFFGYISALEWIALVEIHLRHHEQQRQRIMNHLNI